MKQVFKQYLIVHEESCIIYMAQQLSQTQECSQSQHI